MEFGPRALGARCIIGDARSTNMQTQMNVKIKFRESFRPFAPVVLESSPRSTLICRRRKPLHAAGRPGAEEQRRADAERQSEGKAGLDLLRIDRSTVPAITHVDYSARVQTLTEERNGMFYRIVKSFHAKTGCPVVINTSFNIRGEPIVNTPEEAYRCFMFTDMDALVIENTLLLKDEQSGAQAFDAAHYQQSFRPD